MKTIGVTAGHSNTDPGAVANGTKESVVVTELRDVVATKLRQRGYTVLTDGGKGDNKPLNDAIRIVSQVDLAVELHLNAAANPKATGVETIALSKRKQFSQRLSKSVAGVLGLKVRGDGGYIDQSQSARGRLGFVSAGGVILEVGFISNPGDLRAIKEKLWLVATAIADTIVEELAK